VSLRSAIPALRRGLAPAIERGLERASVRGVALARQRVPVDTSALQRTIRSEGPERQGDAVTYTILAGDPSATRPNDGQPVTYAPFIEWGTSRSPAQPFMTPMARELRPEQDVRDEVARAIKGATL
jgi:HK97 gp10 family phage protein